MLLVVLAVTGLLSSVCANDLLVVVTPDTVDNLSLLLRGIAVVMVRLLGARPPPTLDETVELFLKLFAKEDILILFKT